MAGIGVYEWNRFKKIFPEMALECKAFVIDSHHPHAIRITLYDGSELYFACGQKPTEFTLTTDEATKNFLRFGHKFKK